MTTRTNLVWDYNGKPTVEETTTWRLCSDGLPQVSVWCLAYVFPSDWGKPYVQAMFYNDKTQKFQHFITEPGSGRNIGLVDFSGRVIAWAESLRGPIDFLNI